jgi:hypothetical protein
MSPIYSYLKATYGRGMFVALTGSGSVYNTLFYSENGFNWAATTFPSSLEWSAIGYGNGRFVAVATHGGTAA